MELLNKVWLGEKSAENSDQNRGVCPLPAPRVRLGPVFIVNEKYQDGFNKNRADIHACGWAGAVMEKAYSRIWAKAVIQKPPENSKKQTAADRLTDRHNWL